jgi:hypothetical protein
MSLADNYRLIRNRIDENHRNCWKYYQSYQYLAEIDDLKSFLAGYDGRELTAEEYGLIESIEAHIGRLEELLKDLLYADRDELMRLYNA